MNDPADIRRANLRAIIERDGLTSAAQRFKRPDRQLNDMLSDPPRKAFGERIARTLEHNYDPSRPAGWLDIPPNSERSIIRELDARHVIIPQYAAGGAMGDGLVLPEQPGIIEKWTVSRDWIEKNARGYTAVGNLCIVTGFGPSMRPMFNPGDPLLVDRGVTSVQADGVYFFRIGNEGFIKQVQKIPTASGLMYRAKSANPDYDGFDITPDMDFEILGKVIRVWCGTDSISPRCSFLTACQRGGYFGFPLEL